VLGLCAEAGIVDAGVLAVDGTKLKASASNHATRSYDRIAAEILAEAGRIDAAEDEVHGEARGDELPEHLASRGGRRAWLREAKERLEAERAAEPEPVLGSDRSDSKSAAGGWSPIGKPSGGPTEYEAYRARGVMRDGRRFGAPPKPHTPPAQPEGKINLTDPDSKNMKAYRGYVQGYNTQAVTTRDQIIVAAEIAPDGLDFAQLDPMVAAAERELEQAGVKEQPGMVLADAGYWSNDHIDRLRERGLVPLVAADAHKRDGPRKTRLGGPYDFMRRVLQTDKGAELYSHRQWMVEPVFADIKQNRRAGRFKRRGRAAVRSEWSLIAATHNLLKLHRHTLAAVTG
jgi:Transposase DDE domain